MSRPTIRLIPASPAEYDDFVTDQIREFAEQKVRAGHWRIEEARELSRHAVESFLPDGGPSEGHRVYRAVDTSNRGVGWMGVGARPVRLLGLPARWWPSQLTVVAPVRGK